jgi:CRISPR type III-A-associated RAMP protein Csm4
VDKLFRSDRLYSAVTLAMQQFGVLDEWLQATARAQPPRVVFSSLFPSQAETLFVTPPRTLWPPPSGLVTAPSPVFLSKLRWDAAQFVPTSLLDELMGGRAMLGEQWAPDPESGCLLRRDRPSVSPFRVVTRTRAAIDRLNQRAGHADSFACVEFEPSSGLWCVVRFADDTAQGEWSTRVQAALRLLADSGFGAGRSIGWGQTNEPEMREGTWPKLLFPRSARTLSFPNGNGSAHSYWLLSLYSPAASEMTDWSSGNYELVTRGGHSRKTARLVAEGSVIVASREPAGTAVDIAPPEHSHPVYRAGFALALRLPEIIQEDIQPVETPSDEEAPEPKPCPTIERREPAIEQPKEEPQPELTPEPETSRAEEPQIEIRPEPHGQAAEPHAEGAPETEPPVEEPQPPQEPTDEI